MSIQRQLPHTWTLHERSAAADPAAVDLKLIIVQVPSPDDKHWGDA